MSNEQKDDPDAASVVRTMWRMAKRRASLLTTKAKIRKPGNSDAPQSSPPAGPNQDAPEAS